MSDSLSTGKTLPTGTVTFLFTDIEGSTPHWERQSDLMEEALKLHGVASVLEHFPSNQHCLVLPTCG